MIYKEQEILKWANAKGLLKPENVLTQFAKTVSEVGELGDVLIKDNLTECEDAIGDCFITLVILANQKGLTMEQCIGSAYEVIKNRKGKTLANGNFVKDEVVFGYNEHQMPI